MRIQVEDQHVRIPVEGRVEAVGDVDSTWPSFAKQRGEGVGPTRAVGIREDREGRFDHGIALR